MSSPGSNLLKYAFTMMGTSVIQYYRFTGSAFNSVGQPVSVYADPVPIRCSFQPVPRNLYDKYGLDLSKNFSTIYTLTEMIGVERDISGDQVTFAGRRYQCESADNWYNVDKWISIFVSDFGAA